MITPTSPARWLAWRGTWGLPVLIAACIFLLPVGRAAELPMAILAAAGVWLLARKPALVLSDPGSRTLAGLFACLWLPMLLALPDAIDPGRGLSTTLVFLRFLFMGLFILYCLRLPDRTQRILVILGAVLSFWALDGLLQAFAGVNLLGHAHIGGQLTGMFHPRQTLGVVLAVLSPLFLLWLLEQARRRPWLWLLAPAYGLTILLSGKRSAWIMLAAALAAGALVVLGRLTLRRRLVTLGIMGALLVAGGWGIYQNPHFRAKAQTTAGLFSSDFELANAATSYRLAIWRVAGDIYADHWLNGVGPRSFRNIYPDYAPPDDYFMKLNPESGPTHPHQIVLEIAVETGLIGIAGYLLVWAWLLREFGRAVRARADDYLPWLTALGVALLPLNAGNALYASMWSGIVFWLMTLTLARRPAWLAASR